MAGFSAHQLESYLEHYLESISDLPPTVRRNFGLIRELDQKSRDGLAKIEADTRAYMSGLRKGARKDTAASAELLASIREQYRIVVQLGEEKAQLALNTYKLLDQQIQKLDNDLKKFEAELQASGSEPLSQASAISDILSTASASSLSSPSATIPRRKRGRLTSSGTTPTTPTASPAPSPAPSKKNTVTPRSRKGEMLDVDMPIDPHEPLYCICERVSFGEMVKCDNDECPYEWFHFECVNLTAPPRGKWLCPKCRKQ